MLINLSGKKALVGGASDGIGKGIAMELASAGAEVYLMSRNEEKLIAALQELDTSKGQKHGYLTTDFTDFNLHQQKLSEFFNQHQIDILVNNTNGPQAGNVLSKGIADYQMAFDLLFKNAVLATELCLEHMKSQGFGRIINVSSLTVKEPQDNLVLSNSMRIALVSWSKSLSVAVAPYGITVNTVLTGYFDTARLRSLMEMQSKSEGVSISDIEERRKASIPVKRLGLPAEYGFLVTFLASDYAAYLNGASIPLDGGLSKVVF